MTASRIAELGTDRPDEFRWSEVAAVVGMAVVLTLAVAGALALGWWIYQHTGAVDALALAGR